MKQFKISTVSAHEGEDHSRDTEIDTILSSPSMTVATYIILVLIVLIGGFLLLYQYGKRNKK